MLKVLVLDAMGVIYKNCDDVEELLIPFVKSNGGIDSIEEIKKQYISASLGKISSKEFWDRVNINSSFEPQYLEGHSITDNLVNDILEIRENFDLTVCLSNDVSEWSKSLRMRFKIENLLNDWFISGDLGFRKPDKEIYQEIVKRYGSDSMYYFVDDNERNVKAANQLGWKGFVFKKNKLNDSLNVDGCQIVELSEIVKYI